MVPRPRETTRPGAQNMIPKEYNTDFWLLKPPDTVEVTCLMPNGICILLEVSYNASLSDIKWELWEKATKYPLWGKLHDMSAYVFTCINSMAEREELLDETKCLSDVKPTFAVLRIESIGNEPDNSVNVQIGHLIGRRVQEFDSLNNPEINDFRFKMRKMADEMAQERSKFTWEEKLYYQFPPRIRPVTTNHIAGMKKLSENIQLVAKFDEHSFKFSVSPNTYPTKLLDIILSKRSVYFNKRNEKHRSHVLKVCGHDEYLVGDHPIVAFQYIQDMVLKDLSPALTPVLKEEVPVFIDNEYECVDNFDTKKTRASYSTLRKKAKYLNSWTVTNKFSITICSLKGLNCDKKISETKIGVQAGLFHGGKSLCERQKSTIQSVEETTNESVFNESLEFDIQVCNIPRNAKLCFFIYEVPKVGTSKLSRTRKGKEYTTKESSFMPIAWANTTVYDFKGQLKTGAMTLYMWTFDMNYEDNFNILGNVVNNPDTQNATAFTMLFNSYSEEQSILYSYDIQQGTATNHPAIAMDQQASEELIENCRRLLTENDNLYEIHEQDKKNMWLLKDYWRSTAPEVLPKLLSSIDWDNKEAVSETAQMLRTWPKLPVEKSLELLDYAYPDQEVRGFAVKCLQDVSDEDLLLYLLQLVQALKHEVYLDCDLVKFLIRRALSNQRIGHFLFWHLRSELQVPSVSVRFALILEAYCRGSHDHMPILLKQLEFLEKLKTSREYLRHKSKEKAKHSLMLYLSETRIDDTVRNIRSPLDPSIRCSRVILEKCRVMDSKMRPLWIVMENSDKYGDDVYLIFKDGDDLRQDMLTLQMLKIMDRIWKMEGLDMKLNLYGCISLEQKVGMIEVVLNAETIANIQKEKGMFTATSAFSKGSVLAWIKDHNITDVSLNKAIEDFTLSCAGYCVATYVLGIADRHSDNIMIRTNGELFHIDFGHILGHFKEKFGFKRERVPFVLTHDFVFVINKGQKTMLEFRVFQEFCEKAFLILRKHGNLILSLCAMMISTGLPELSSEKDLNYLRDTLVLYKSEEDALGHFRIKFNEALSNSWKTSLNWASHNLAKNNKA